MQRQSWIATWCDRIIEGGWLLALVLIPSYFNLLSSRHFEPDKATSLRAIVLVMIAAAFVRWLDTLGGAAPTSAPPRAPAASLWQRIRAVPMAIPVLLYALVFLLATATSIAPYASFWGSYQRLQGTYTNLSYVALGALVAFNLRRREQLDRLVTALVLGSLPAIGYGIIQHFQLDPLPWRGDVVARVASTMGNSIFVAAYLILTLPFALARSIAALSAARTAPQPDRPSLDWLWGLAYALLVGSALLIVFAALQFGAVVQTIDLRYWWVYPGALISALGIFLLPTLQPDRAERGGATIWTGGITLAYLVLVAALFAIGQASGGQAIRPIPGRPGVDWPLWMVAGGALAAIGYAMVIFLPRRSGPPSRLGLQLQAAGMGAVALATLVTIFFTQSRGPWIGGMAGLFIFLFLLLVLAGQRARRAGSSRAGLWRNLLIGVAALAISVGGFLVLFNVSDAPFFQQLRDAPYIGRMGRLLEIDEGTGLVRKLIWVGDEHAGGAVALITSDPVRAVIGYGPESMFVAYNRFYPPALANIESRGASPDRSHEAYLDELINKGALGLLSYLFVLFSFFALARRLLQRIDDWPTQVLLAACVAAVSAHAVEGLTGIPIVATLMLLWVTIAICYAAGALHGEYSASEPSPAPEPEPGPAQPAPAPDSGARARQNQGRRRPSAQRGSAQRAPAPARASGGAAGMLVYALVMIGALVAVWSFNVDNVYADMRFQQGQNYTEDPQADLDRFVVGTAYYLDSIRMEPQQDFYYLSLGRSLMSIVDIRRQVGGGDLGQPRADVKLSDLLQLQDAAAVQSFATQQPPLALMSYAEKVLLEAQRLSPLNKDHYANLGRMYNFWFNRLQRDPTILERAVDWYRRGTEVAPQDVTILNEYASVLAIKGNVAREAGDEAAAAQSFALANQLLARSAATDPKYRDTDMRTAEVLRMEGRLPEAVDRYLVLLQANPRALDGQITSIIQSLRGQPDQLLRLRGAYEAVVATTPNDFGSHALIGLISARANDLPRAAQAFAEVIRLQPDNLEARQNYTLVLSDMLQYQQAAGEAQTLLDLAKQQGANQQESAALQGLLDFLQQKAAAP